MKLLEHQLSIMPEHHAQNTVEQCLTNARTHLRRTTHLVLLSNLSYRAQGGSKK